MESDDLMGATMQPHHDAPPRRRSGPSPGQLGGRALAQQKLFAMRRRARRIRRLVAGLTAATFTAAFLVVYVQLASGHDPALSAAAKRSSTSATQQTRGESSSSSSSSSVSGGESSASSSSGSAESSSGPSAVTTAQS
jgi:uncharacterized membrane protein YgcG